MSSPPSLSPSPSSGSAIPRIRPGDGRITVEFDPHRGHTFAQLSSTYPLKLLSPRSKEDPVAIVYVLSYGGGLVGGDEVELEVAVREGASLMLLSQVRSPSHLGFGRGAHSRRVPPKCSRSGSRPTLTFKDKEPHLVQNRRVR